MASAIVTIARRDGPSAAQAALPQSRGVPLLAAEWRDLAMVNFEIDPRVLDPHVPAGTELDCWGGASFVSVVGFQFLHARLFGIRIPLHGNFEEVNLRFYVRRRVADGWRRGVVFLREIVPRRAVAWTARAFGENFCRLPMSRIVEPGRLGEAPRRVEYHWHFAGRRQRLALETAAGAPRQPDSRSLDQFIVEHYWAYTALPRRRTREAFVVHPPWQIAPATAIEFDADVRELYGPQFAPFLRRRPASAFWADGSAVRVHKA
jgi:uncharacterized protein YqjF (DUF2071 family)